MVSLRLEQFSYSYFMNALHTKVLLRVDFHLAPDDAGLS